jgi:hypothetical protein
MLDQIRAIALEKLGSEEAADAFMAGFEKVATEKAASVADFLGGPFGRPALGLGASLLGAGIVAGIAKGGKALEHNQLRGKFDMALAQVISTNKVVKGSRPEKVREFAETFFRFAPHVASDANLLGTILANAIQGESIDPQTMKSLVDLEARYVDNHRINPLPGIRT